MSKPIIVGYWDLHGLGDSIRLVLELVGADYVNELYNAENADTWFEDKRDNLDLLYPNIPYIIDNDVKMTEHLPILRYLARKYDLCAKVEEEIRITDQTETFITDLRSKMSGIAFATDKEARAKSVEKVRKKLPYLNKLLEKREYIAGSKLTYVDILVFDVLSQIRVFEASLIDKNANLVRFIDNINKLPNIAKYVATDEYKNRPFFSKEIYAVFQQKTA